MSSSLRARKRLDDLVELQRYPPDRRASLHGVMASRRQHWWIWKLQVYLVIASGVVVFVLFKSYQSSLPDSPEHVFAHISDSLSSHERHRSLSLSANNPHIYSFVIDVSHVCNNFEEVPTLIVFVTSAPGHKSSREAIRETWGLRSYLKHRNIKLLFLLGRSNMNTEISAESQVHGDIVQGDFVDSYGNLTLKSVMMLHWTQSFCPSVDYIMKTDDDVYVNLDNLLPHLQHTMYKERRWIQGCIKRHAAVPARTVNGVPVGPVDERTMPRAYPAFVAGAGYVISGDLVADLLAASAQVKWMPVEDVFVTAKCAAIAGVVPETDDRFSCGRGVQEPCEMRHMFTGHGMTAELMRRVWDAMLGSCS